MEAKAFYGGDNKEINSGTYKGIVHFLFIYQQKSRNTIRQCLYTDLDK